jgi:hypothetical protein
MFIGLLKPTAPQCILQTAGDVPHALHQMDQPWLLLVGLLLTLLRQQGTHQQEPWLCPLIDYMWHMVLPQCYSHFSKAHIITIAYHTGLSNL